MGGYMALVVNDLAAAISAQLNAQFSPSTSVASGYTPTTQWDELGLAIATAVVNYIHSNAEVLPTSMHDGMGAPITGTGTVL
jgi:hypothetical protein